MCTGGIEMDGGFSIKYELDECKKNAIFWENIDLTKLPNACGIVIIFIDDITEVIFKEEIIEDKEVNPYLLRKYVENFTEGILYFKNVKNIKKEISKFQHTPRKNASKPEIIFNQIANKTELKIGFKVVAKSQFKNKALMDDFLRIYHKKPVMNVQFKSNDATPSWNGFNYQGFLTILRTLEYMNRLSEPDYINYFVEIEKYEDFIIYKNDSPKELFQVKAHVVEKGYSDYIEACEKLLEHKEQIKADNAKCYLATASEVINWNQSNYVEVIELYGYKTGNFVSTSDIIDHIKKEIANYFEKFNIEKDQLEIDYAFACISRLIIDKVNYLHCNRSAKAEEYRINFSYIANVLNKSAADIVENNVFFTKLSIDKKVLDNFESTLLEHCEYCEKKSCESCPLNELWEKFERIDRGEYAKILDPTLTFDEKGIYISELFNSVRIEELLEILENINLDLLFYDNKHIYVANNICSEDYLDKIIPSSIKIKNSGPAKVLQKIKEDFELQKIYYNSAVVVDMKKDKFVYQDEIFHQIPESLMKNNNQDKGKSILPDFNCHLVNKDIFIERSRYNE